MLLNRTFLSLGLLVLSLPTFALTFQDVKKITGYYRCTIDVLEINQSFTDQYISAVERDDGSFAFAPVDIGAAKLAFIGYGYGTTTQGDLSGKTNTGGNFKFTKSILATEVRAEIIISGNIEVELDKKLLNSKVNCTSIF